MFIQSNGSRVYFPPRGPVGPDGNPIGTVISYMGKTAPKDYLICDGSIYYISAYPELTAFFEEQFGSKNYFGGDGTSTFAVPDMRNLFLRGYKGEATEQLSGEVGVKQEATEHLRVTAVNGKLYMANDPNIDFYAANTDSTRTFSDSQVSSVSAQSNPTMAYSTYTSRPVNMAILYCIKYQTSVPEEYVYSTEERVVGRWIDGKPLYEKTFYTNAPSTQDTTKIADVSVLSIDTKVSIDGMLSASDGAGVPFNTYNTKSGWSVTCIFGKSNGVESILMTIHNVPSYLNSPVSITIRYTKTTDLAPTGDPAAIPQSNEVQTASYDFYQDYDEEVT